MYNPNLPPKFLYIHWPFCKSKCWYCDFVSFEKHEKLEKTYHTALCKEIQFFANNINKIKTIFIGGGTPSIYPPNLIANLFETLKNNYSFQELKEVTIEVNPESTTKKLLHLWKSIGINRLSIGIQALDENALKTLNRHQTNNSVFKLLESAPLFFENISVDLILGLPNVTEKTWQKTLEYITSKPITHVSIYFLTIYEKTPLYFKIKNKKIVLPDENLITKNYEETVEFLEKSGFIQYEISNFAKPNFESIHNQAYWNRQSYKGFGLNAASFDQNKRFINTNNLAKYLNYWNNSINFTQSNIPQNKELITPKQAFLEKLMLELRQKKGMDLQHMLYFLNRDKSEMFLNKVKILKSKNLIDEKNGRIFLTIRGMVLENEVILNLF